MFLGSSSSDHMQHPDTLSVSLSISVPPLLPPRQLCPIIVIKKKRKLDSDFPHVLTWCAASSPLIATCLCMQYARRGPPLPGAEFTYWFLTEIIFTIPLQYLNNLHLHPSAFACSAAPPLPMWGVVIGGCTISWHCCGWHFSILCFGIIAFFPPPHVPINSVIKSVWIMWSVLRQAYFFKS